ncbi:DUF523 domain-containing protein [Thermosulfurimonas marina]|uniref:DUF523 domain-containing protein n=1 Tax=Thermosulfurimonas marina TaxID=2047767 RepID=A0A6H1WSV3_9BACT|nr:DUF523 domain-containing protein [Thermosulfurimonas marina]QJA06251.1 DUF523 domain-containing protein [Thermosulfurimonas marina]
MRETVLVSACLLGLATRYDGKRLLEPRARDLLERYRVVPVCPEQLGGLPTPRPPAEILGGDGGAVLSGAARVINARGEDVTGAFLRGAEEVLRLARLLGARQAFLKAQSPSCGLHPLGVTAALLLREGLEVYEWA